MDPIPSKWLKMVNHDIEISHQTSNLWILQWHSTDSTSKVIVVVVSSRWHSTSGQCGYQWDLFGVMTSKWFAETQNSANYDTCRQFSMFSLYQSFIFFHIIIQKDPLSQNCQVTTLPGKIGYCQNLMIDSVSCSEHCKPRNIKIARIAGMRVMSPSIQRFLKKNMLLWYLIPP